jgi:Suppressor of fused protein (SUFU)
MAAFYHANPWNSIKLGDTLEIGFEWLEKSSCDHLLVSLPYPFSSALETIKVNDIYVSFWWLVPITKSEALYTLKLMVMNHYGKNLMNWDWNIRTS